MPIHHPVSFVEDCTTIDGAHLIRFGDSQRFGLTCRLKNDPMWVSFNDEANLDGPLLIDPYGPCVSLGSEFTVGFDPAISPWMEILRTLGT